MKLSALLIAIVATGILLPVSGHSDEMTNKLCAASADNMEQVAKGRDAKQPEAAAHAQQNGALANEMVSLIYQTPQFSPAHERAAVFKVCVDTNAFSAENKTILQAIRVALAAAQR